MSVVRFTSITPTLIVRGPAGSPTVNRDVRGFARHPITFAERVG